MAHPFHECSRQPSKPTLCVQECKRQTGRISAVYAFGMDSAPTRQARACLVEHTISAVELTCTAVRSAKVNAACCQEY